MKILKNFRKPHFAFFLASLLLFVSCTVNDAENNPELKFNYSTYETYKDINFNLKIPFNITSLDNKIDRYKKTINFINEELGSNLFLTELDYQLLNNNLTKKSKSDNITEFLSSTDIYLINAFNDDLKHGNLTSAVTNFEKNVYKLNLSESDFGKYNAFVNLVLLLDNQAPGIFKASLYAKNPCAEAVASYSLATLGLVACAATGPAAPLFCTAAVVAKVLAFRAVMRDCGGNN